MYIFKTQFLNKLANKGATANIWMRELWSDKTKGELLGLYAEAH